MQLEERKPFLYSHQECHRLLESIQDAQERPTMSPVPGSPKLARPHQGASYRSALWESENPSASVSFTMVQSNTSPARVLKVFPERVNGQEEGSGVSSQGPGKETEEAHSATCRKPCSVPVLQSRCPNLHLWEGKLRLEGKMPLAHRHVIRMSWARIQTRPGQARPGESPYSSCCTAQPLAAPNRLSVDNTIVFLPICKHFTI